MRLTGILRTIAAPIAIAAASLTLLPAQATAEEQLTTHETLLDRIQIEDLVTSYYWDLTSEGRAAIASHYTEDATFEVNGVVFTGYSEIQALYPAEDDMGAGEGGRFTMLMNNPLIRVDGDTATADMIFTGLISDVVSAPPRLFEQGSDHMEFVKRDGRWMISRRVLTSYAGLPADSADNLEILRQTSVEQ